MTPHDYITTTYPGPITIPVLDKVASHDTECDWAACPRVDYRIAAGEPYLVWKGIKFCADCYSS